MSPWSVRVESAEGMILGGVWCLADIEVSSAKTDCLKKTQFVSINHLKLQKKKSWYQQISLNYKASEKYATEELAGYNIRDAKTVGPDKEGKPTSTTTTIQHRWLAANNPVHSASRRTTDPARADTGGHIWSVSAVICSKGQQPCPHGVDRVPRVLRKRQVHRL